MLDIEVVGAIAPAAQIVVYFAPNTTLGWLRAISTAIHDSYHNPSVISISWGGPENTWGRAAIEAMNYSQIPRLPALWVSPRSAGQPATENFTDGIAGSKAHVDFPASSPFVLACGGTRLDSSGGKICGGVGLERLAEQRDGWRVSEVFAMPSYQTDANVPPSINPPHFAGTRRA